MWRQWILDGIIRWLKWKVQIVIPRPPAKARIAAALEKISQAQLAESPSLEKSEIATLLRRRIGLRKNRNFSEADKIRDQLTEAGVNVRDQAT